MSLILDALRRADSEREQGEVPGLHAHPAPALVVDETSAPRARAWLLGGLIAVGVLLVALAGYLIGREAPPPAAVAVATPPPESVATAPSAAPLAARPADLQEIAEPARWPGSEKRGAPERPASSVPAEKLQTEKTLAQGPVDKPVAAKVEAPVPAVPAESPVYRREQLPENIRAELPPLQVGGSIYSTDAASRSLIINGRILRENDRLTADLWLEQIKLKAAVLRYKGYRFEIQF